MMEMEAAYPEKLAERILARAIAVDRVRGDNYPLAELRSIADEAGVSKAALNQTLQEMHPGSPDPDRALRLATHPTPERRSKFQTSASWFPFSRRSPCR